MRAIHTWSALALACAPALWAGELTKLEQVEFKGDIFKAKNVSGVGVAGPFLIIGADEGGRVQVLRRDGDHFRLLRDIVLDTEDEEIDIEGIACDGNTIYVMGSHSAKREKVEEDSTYAKNRESIATTGPEPSRDRVFRFMLDGEGKAGTVETTSLRSVIDHDKVLKAFREIPSKENGVDIEGVAVRGGQVFAGFRGPVLRGNYTPVLMFTFSQPVVKSELLFTDLFGRGVRDLVKAEGGFLILAGPVGDGPGSYQLYFWDGRDCLPGHRSGGTRGQTRLLCEIPAPDDAKAEGIALLKETDAAYEFLIVYDGLKDGGPTRFRLSKP